MKTLAQLQADRDIVTITRDGIDPNALHGYVLAASNDFIILQQVCDFQIDCRRVLRVDDITELRCDETNDFQKQMLRADGVEDQVPFDAEFDLRSWRTLIEQLSAQHELLIFECESLDDDEAAFHLGRVVEVDDEHVHILCFSGTAEWSETPDAIALENLTMCQFASNYIEAYRRHFARQRH